MNISLVPRDGLAEIWPAVSGFLEKAVSRSGGRFDMASVYVDLASGAQTLWVAFDDDRHVVGCWTLRIYDYPLRRACILEWVGGKDIKTWVYDGVAMIRKYAADCGCDLIEAQGREGWTMFLQEIGWTRGAVQYQCELKKDD